MDIVQKRMVMIAYLESAMEFAEQIEDGTTAYLMQTVSAATIVTFKPPSLAPPVPVTLGYPLFGL